jgi:hypothetical protein
MRIVSVIAAFAFATAVVADVTPSSTGMAEATSLQTRHLRGEVHEVRIRPHKPKDGTVSSKDESTSAEVPAGGDQAPPIRKRKSPSNGEEAPSTENDNGVAFTSERLSTSIVRKVRFANFIQGPSGRSSGNLVSSHQPKSILRKKKVNALIIANGGRVASIPGQPSSSALPPLRRQYGELNLNRFDTSDSPASSGNIAGTWIINRRGVDPNDPLSWLLK